MQDITIQEFVLCMNMHNFKIWLVVNSIKFGKYFKTHERGQIIQLISCAS